jgi:hypothetical protein
MRLLLFFFFCIFIHSATAQFMTGKKVVLPLYDLEKSFGIAPTGREGLVLYHESTGPLTTGKRTWQVVFLDENLAATWDSSFESERNFVISQVKYAAGYVYLLFLDTNIPMKSVFFVRCKVSSRKFEFFQIREFLPAEVVGFEILGNALFLIGKNFKRPAILRFNYGDPRPVALRGLYDGDSEILHTSVDRKLQYMQVITRMKKGSKNMILVKKFDESGSNLRDISIESSKGYQMINAIAKTDTAGNTAVVGTFSYKRSRFSNGVFTGVFNTGGSSQLYYYDYINLHNYFNFLPDVKSIEKARRKYVRKSDGSSYRVNHVPRSINAEGGEWQFLGEVFHLTQRVSRSHQMMWKKEFAEYSHAIALGIDREGRLRWDDTFAMNTLISPEIGQQAFLHSDGWYPMVFYTDGFMINFKITGKNQSTTGTAEIDNYVKEYTSEKVERYANLMHWYDNVFIAYGENTLYSSHAEPRHTFYMFKIVRTNTVDQ